MSVSIRRGLHDLRLKLISYLINLEPSAFPTNPGGLEAFVLLSIIQLHPGELSSPIEIMESRKFDDDGYG